MEIWKKVWISMTAAFMVCVLTGCGKKSNSEIYGATIAALGDEELFEIIEMDTKYPVLLVTDGYYEDGNGNRASIWCEVYYLVGDEVKNLGSVSSSGTAYPISYDTSGIYVGGNHNLGKYRIDEKMGALILSENILESFDENGNGVYSHETEEGTEIITEEEYYAMPLWKDYEETRRTK